MSEENGQNQEGTQSGSGDQSSGVLGGAGSQGESSSWIDSLEESFRGNATISGIKAETMPEALNAMANMTINAQKLVGVDKIPALKAGASSDEIRAWKQAHLGVPETRDAYEAIKDYKAGVNEDGTDKIQELDETVVVQALDVASELGLNQGDANRLAALLSEQNAKAQEASKAELNQVLSDKMAQFKQEMGNNFQLTMDAAEASLTRLASEDLVGVLGKYPEITNNPEFIKIFADIGFQSQDARSINSGQHIQPQSPIQALARIKEIQRSDDWQKILKGDSSVAAGTKEALSQEQDLLYKQAYPN